MLRLLPDLDDRMEPATGFDSFYRNVCESSPLGMVVTSPDRRIVQTNAAFRETLSYTDTELNGRDVRELVAPEDQARSGNCWDASLWGPDQRHGTEIRFLTKQGRTVWLRLKCVPLKQSVDATPVLTVTEDVTEHMRRQTAVRESDLRYRALFETMQDGVIIVDGTGRYVEVNSAMSRILRTTPDRLIGRHYTEFIPPERVADAQIAFEALLDGLETPVDFPLLAVDGAVVECSWTSTSKYLPGLYFCVCRDITDRKRSEQDLRRVNEDLKQFAWSASHDLREPLRMITVYCQLLQRKYSGKLGAEADRYIFNATIGAQRMEMLVRDLLAYTQVAHTEFPQTQASDPNAALDETISHLRDEIVENAASIERDRLPDVIVPRTHLVLLFQHLIGNALKYRGEEPPVVRVKVRPANHAKCEIRVEDNGIGIDPQYGDQVFGLFRRLHARDKYAGTGLGLAICKKITEAAGGRIWVESEGPGKGSAFCFTVPLAG